MAYENAYSGWATHANRPGFTNYQGQRLPAPAPITGNQQPPNTGIGQAVQDVDIARIINEQIAQTQKAQENTVQARQQGADILGGAINSQTALIQNLLAKLQGNTGQINQGFNDARDQIIPRLNMTTGETALENSLISGLDKDVISPEMIAKLETLGRERAGAAFRGAKSNANIDFARRGLSGTGLEKETELGFMQDALNAIMQNSVEAELSGASLNAENKSRTQGLLGEHNAAFGGRINTLLGLLSSLADSQAGANIDMGQLGVGAVTSMNPLISQMASIHSDTGYEPPDLSGFLGLGMQNRELNRANEREDLFTKLLLSQMAAPINEHNRILKSWEDNPQFSGQVVARDNPYQKFLDQYFGSN